MTGEDSTERRATFADFAQRYSELGWPLVRVQGKRPRDTDWQKVTPAEPNFAAGQWAGWGDRFNMGVVLGDTLAVFEYDTDEAQERFKALLGGKLPKTPVCRTGSGRLHVYFANPGRLEKGALEGLELRVGAHQMLVPPSVHPDTGTAYEWLEGRAPWDVPLAELPAEIRDYFAAVSSRNGAARATSDTIPEGQRNSTLTSLAGSMRRRGMSEAEILAALEVANETRCSPPLPQSDVERIARSVARYEPATALVVDVQPGSAAVLDVVEFQLVPVEWEPILADGVPEFEYADEPYLPRRKRIWGVGAAEAGKSIWAAARACALTHAGFIVVYFSQENGLEEEVRRFMRLGPNYENLRLYVDQGLDLKIPEHVSALINASQGATLVVLDTLSACWSGDEDSNAEVTAFDRDVLLRLIRETGASPLVLDHTGNPQPFANRRGVSAPRGASAKGQKADFLLEFRASGDCEFTIHHAKARGARKQPPQSYRVVDSDDGRLEVVEIESSPDEKAQAVADGLVEAIVAAPDGFLTSNAMRDAGKRLGAGVGTAKAAMDLLESEEPRRVTVAWETIETGKGRQRAHAWRPFATSEATSEATLGV